MRAFLPRLRRPGPLLPPLRLWLLTSPPLPDCRFPRPGTLGTCNDE